MEIKGIIPTVIILLIVGVLSFVLLLQNIDNSDNSDLTSQKEKVALHCYVGGTMRPVMQEFIALYEKRNPHVDIFIDYAGSGELLIRMEQTKLGDLYIAHDPFMKLASKKNLIVTGENVAIIKPVIAVKKGNPYQIKNLDDLLKDGIDVLLPSRKYSTTGHLVDYMYTKIGKFDQLNESILARLRCPCDAANSLTLDTADAAIVWDAVAFLRADKLDTIEIPKKQNLHKGVDVITTASFGEIDLGVINVSIMVLKFSKHQKESQLFLEFVASDSMKKVWKDFGFTTE